MPVSVIFAEEAPSFSVGGDQESFEEKGTAYGSYVATEIDTAVRAASAATVTSAATSRTLYRQSISYESKGAGVWDFTIPYGPHETKNADDTPEAEFSFDIGTENTKIFTSLATVNKYPALTAPDLKGAINWNGKEAEGVDIMIPKCSLSYKQIIADSTFDATYRRNLSLLVGKVNDGTWEGYSAGELLLTSVSGSFRFKNTDWEISFNIAVSENKSGLSIGAITGITKKGWDYLWVKHKKKIDGDAKFVLEPEYVYVEQVYEYGDYSILPI